MSIQTIEFKELQYFLQAWSTLTDVEIPVTFTRTTIPYPIFSRRLYQ